jgi:ferredoxin
MAVPTTSIKHHETILDNGIMAVDTGLCMHCGACVGACPTNAIFLTEILITFNEDCTQCGLCVKACPVGAIDFPRGHKRTSLK